MLQYARNSSLKTALLCWMLHDMKNNLIRNFSLFLSLNVPGHEVDLRQALVGGRRCEVTCGILCFQCSSLIIPR